MNEPNSTVMFQEQLRAEMCVANIDYLIISHADEFQNEFLQASAERLAFIIQFSGSSGVAVLTREEFHLFVRPMYVEQAKRESSDLDVVVHDHCDVSFEEWLKKRLRAADRVGVDPWLHTDSELRSLRDLCSTSRAEIVMLKHDLIDRVWEHRPPVLNESAVPHPLRYAGTPHGEKLDDIEAKLRREGCDAVIITSLESIAWVLNIRGGDNPITPIVSSRLVVEESGGAMLFIDSTKAADDLNHHLGSRVEVRCLSQFECEMRKLAANQARVVLDRDHAPAAVTCLLESDGAIVVHMSDLCAISRATKNATEIEGARRAHLFDGVAMARFLCWLEGALKFEQVDECSAADKLLGFRRDRDEFVGISFHTISGTGPNAAMPHYRPTEDTKRMLSEGDLYMVDSGGQYLCGTTDVTRTIAVGVPMLEARDRFTRVLKGHIALATAKFPLGTTGGQLDAIARRCLWDVGLDYPHGTGHGIGSFLGVHEFPPKISTTDATVLLPGMIVTNEPGYYKRGHYGIRIENVMLVVELKARANEDRSYLGFETLTLAPIDLSLIDTNLLTHGEIKWINEYHDRVRTALSPQMNDNERQWLKERTFGLRRCEIETNDPSVSAEEP